MIYIDIKNLVGRGNETILPVTADKAIIMTSDDNNRLDASYQALISRINAIETSLIKNPPTGAILAYAGYIAPDGWLLCNGGEISRTTYAALFAILGTTYGAGDGSTTFALPNLQGRVPVGYDVFLPLGGKEGARTAALTAANNGPHTHVKALGYGVPGNEYSDPRYWGKVTAGTETGDILTSSSGSGAPFSIMQPSLGVNYIIKK